jgi:hypothetical protein
VSTPRDDRPPSREEVWEERGDRLADAATNHPGRTAAKVMAVILALSFVFGIIGWLGGWWNGVKETTGFQNTRTQAYQLRDDYNNLVATAGNVCDAEKAQGESSPNDPQIVGGDPAFQYKATYRRIAADYNRRMDNAFEAGWVRHYPVLNDLPRKAPTLDQATAGC